MWNFKLLKIYKNEKLHDWKVSSVKRWTTVNLPLWDTSLIKVTIVNNWTIENLQKWNKSQM